MELLKIDLYDGRIFDCQHMPYTLCKVDNYSFIFHNQKKTIKKLESGWIFVRNSSGGKRFHLFNNITLISKILNSRDSLKEYGYSKEFLHSQFKCAYSE